MCSRFELSTTPRELIRRFGLGDAPPMPNRPELRPTKQALVVERPSERSGAGGERSGDAAARLVGWGLAVEWSAKPLINARAETLAEKRTFRPLLGRRCLVPATAYFEWRDADGAKRKNRIRPGADGAFAFAGLSDGERFTIVTCAPAPEIAHIHGRMPVILEPAGETRWIDPDVPFADVAGLLVPYPGALTWNEDAAPPAAAAGQKDLFG